MGTVNKIILISLLVCGFTLIGFLQHYKSKADQLSLALANTESALEQSKQAVEALEKRTIVSDELRAKYIAKEKEIALLKRHYDAKFRQLQKSDASVGTWADQPLPDALLRMHEESRGSKANTDIGSK